MLENFLRHFRKRNRNKEKLMKHFSEEYLTQLINEHKLVSASITALTVTDFRKYVMNHNVDIVTAASSNLKARKVELEAMIDVLTDFLRG